ncbi:alpha-amylase family glycosyl hydrolase [uncultured Treponema sp.]|uniref:alpha-amylase family glycosyl hydrolase n=1 Tax=uncultured Treponema sp. TaxID=162155 RepID=UPI0025ED324B|nr:alpha-amylase family glycosyl hydrolase [uncultured Treponema sp.]
MKKKLRFLFSVVSIVSMLFVSCGSGSDDSNSDSGGDLGIDKQLTVVLAGADVTASWNIWAWQADTNKNYTTGSWPGDVTFPAADEKGYFRKSIGINSSEKLGIIFVKSDGTGQTSDLIVPVEALKANDTLYFIYGEGNYYTSLADLQGLSSASITKKNGRTVVAKYLGDELGKGDVTVTGKDGTVYTVSNVSTTGSSVKISLDSGVDVANRPFTVTIGGKSVLATISSDIIDDVAVVTDYNFGCTLSGSSASFRTFAPTAISVKLLLFKTSSSLKNPDADFEMTASDDGSWSLENVNVAEYKYYKYRIETTTGTNDVCDIWAKAASADSVASQITDINSDSSALPSGLTLDTAWGTKEAYYNPFGNNGAESKKYTDASIYEMHIRDWSRVEVTDSTGKFLDIANGDKVIAHLKDLGITHVQILPMFDYAQTNADNNYNWGYNPYHYNVPEGRYVTAGYEDGTQAVKELRTLIGKLHEAGIAVNMDVVYNHTSGTGSASLYDLTVPEYFYRLDSSGNYYNGSGCGNEVATNHAIVKKYVIESLKHWMLDYHINGFRFDLMGLHEASTMSAIYTELAKIDPNVMVYGEPWTGGDSGVKNGCIKEKLSKFDSCSPSNDVNGVGYFNDTIRDAIKGSVFDQGGKGQVQGVFADDTICEGLLGSVKFATVLGRSLNYVECHDNQTLFDRLAYSNYKKVSGLSDSQMNKIKAEEKLTAAYIFLAQGTPFINGGQEFMRTKNNDHNSYISSDSVNQISLSFKETYADVYNTYKGLIALRKANSDAFGANTSAAAETYNSTKGVTKYTAGDFLVYFNATDDEVSIETSGYTKFVDVANGTPTESTTLPGKVAAKSFVILKK